MEAQKRKIFGWGSYITAGLVFTIAGNFYLKSVTNGLVIVIVSVATLLLYYPLKSKFKFKNEKLKSFTSFIILYILSAFLIPIIILVFNLVILLIGGSSALKTFNSISNRESYSWYSNCKNICIFNSENKVWSINSSNLNRAKDLFKKYGVLFTPAPNSDTEISQFGAKYFQTQEQCIDYCLTQ